MANASTVGFGFRSTMTVGNTPATQGQSEYKIKSGTAKGIFLKMTPCLSKIQVETKVIFKMQLSQQQVMEDQVVNLLTTLLMHL